MNKGNSKILSPWYTTRLKVRYQETDQMAVVYHANYLTWFELGRTGMIAELGFTYREMEEQGILLPVIDAHLKYRQPAHYDDMIVVFTRMTTFSTLRLEYEYEVRRLEKDRILERTCWHANEELPGDLLVTGSTQHVWIGPDWKPVRLDKTAPKLYNALKEKLYEAI